jgi:hypothetical protein
VVKILSDFICIVIKNQPIMGFKVATLWQAPEINPVNGKARSIPILNPINKYGRVFVSDPLALGVWISQQDMTLGHDLHLPIYLP